MEDALLLIDDDEVFLQTMSRSLSRKGETVYAASSPADALKLFARYQPTRVLLDLNLDGESGLQLLPQILDLCPTTRVILLTGYASIATAVEAIKLGADDYLAKPADTADILSALAQGDEAQTTKPAHNEMDLEPMSVRRLEWEHIQKVLAENDYNVSETARQLKMHRRTLQRKLQKKPVAG